MVKMQVLGSEIAVVTKNEEDYISLTDMVKNMENGLALIEKWLRNKNTTDKLKTLNFGFWGEQMVVNRLRYVKKIQFSLHVTARMIKKIPFFDTSRGLYGIFA